MISEKHLEVLIKENIESKENKNTYNSYFKDLKVSSIDSDKKKVTISFRNKLITQLVKDRYYNNLKTLIDRIIDDKEYKLHIDIFKTRKEAEVSREKTATPEQGDLKKINKTKNLFQDESFLNPSYTFDTFIPANNNLLAHAAAQAVADNPGSVYNPLFIYGDVGLGKTHLIQSIGNKARKDNENTKVLYCTTEQFLNDMVTSIRTQKSSVFRDKYRTIDILLLDDVQFLSNKEALQEEFFNTFNTLYQSGKQIVITSDRPPSEIQHLEDRIRSRFEGGLVTDVKKPDFETRVAIIQKKLLSRNEYLPNSIISQIAESVDSNIRELEGAILKVSILSKTKNGNVTNTDIKQFFGSKKITLKKRISHMDVLKAVAEELDIPIKEIRSSKRNSEITYARHLCMYTLKEVLNLQLKTIAKHLGRKDHTTVMHGVRKVTGLLSKDENTQIAYSNITNKLKR